MDNLCEMKAPPTLTGLLRENNQLIRECLIESNQLYQVMTSDSYSNENKEVEPTCIMSDLVIQNENLKKLKSILVATNENVFEGGKK